MLRGKSVLVLAGIAIVAVTIGGLWMRAAGVGAAGTGYAPVDVPNLTLAPPTRPANLTSSVAVTDAEKKLQPSVFAHPYTVEYGSFDFSNVGVGSTGVGAQVPAIGQRDVWKITVTGLSIARPCGATPVRASCPPPVSTLTIFVDDTTGSVLESVGY